MAPLSQTLEPPANPGRFTQAPCGEVLNLVASVRGAIGGLTAELIEDHVREHVMDELDAGARARGAAELIEVVRSYLK